MIKKAQLKGEREKGRKEMKGKREKKDERKKKLKKVN
jgi:hypothetical protein